LHSSEIELKNFGVFEVGENYFGQVEFEEAELALVGKTMLVTAVEEKRNSDVYTVAELVD
jgi:hypothetical protein